MWPWEHLAVGYLLYSAFVKLGGADRVDAAAVAAVVLGTQFPDLVDKPLAWSFDVFPSGVSVAHSVFIAVGLSVVLIAVGAILGHRRVGTAFAIGYLSHLPADLVFPVLVGEPVQPEAFLWPLVVATGPASSGLLTNVVYYASRFLAFLATERGILYLSAEVTLLGLAVLAWLSDGRPGLGVLHRRLARHK